MAVVMVLARASAPGAGARASALSEQAARQRPYSSRPQEMRGQRVGATRARAPAVAFVQATALSNGAILGLYVCSAA